MTRGGSIRVHDVGKRYARYQTERPDSLKRLLKGLRGRRHVEHFWALRDVSFEVAPGEMLGVIGHNGSGKSTLLRLLGGVMRPEEGRVEVAGRIGGLLQLGVGFLSDLSGRENVFTNGIIAGLTRREVARRFDSIVAFAELEDFIDSPLRTYSTGMRMRLGFAIAVHTDPEVLLIDEVLTVGDLAFQQKCLQRIEQYKAGGCAIVFVSHSLEEVQQHCARTLWLQKGRVAALDASERVIAQYRTEMMAETHRRTPEHVGPRTTAGGIDLVMNENRFGSLEMEIERVRLLDARGQETDAIPSRGALTVEISYHAPEPIESPIFTVAISNAHNVNACDVSTDNGELKLPRLHGRGQIRLHFDRLDLSGDAYFVNVGIYDRSWSYTYDYHWHAYPLRIESDLWDSAVFSPPRRWELHHDPASRKLL